MVKVTLKKTDIVFWKKEYNLTENEIKRIAKNYFKRKEDEIDYRLDEIMSDHAHMKREL